MNGLLRCCFFWNAQELERVIGAIWMNKASSRCCIPYIYCQYILTCRRFPTSSPCHGPKDVVPSQVSASGSGSRSSLAHRVGASDSPSSLRQRSGRPTWLDSKLTERFGLQKGPCGTEQHGVYMGKLRGFKVGPLLTTSWLAHEVEEPRSCISQSCISVWICKSCSGYRGARRIARCALVEQ
jgi:hypothetical protein